MKPTLVQRLALLLGSDAGPNSFYLDPEYKRFNRCVWVEWRGIWRVCKSVGQITWRDLPRVLWARVRKARAVAAALSSERLAEAAEGLAQRQEED